MRFVHRRGKRNELKVCYLGSANNAVGCKMACEVKFTEWTRDDRLRQPVFLGIRKAVHETQAFDTGPFSPSTIRPACRLNGCPEPEEMA